MSGASADSPRRRRRSASSAALDAASSLPSLRDVAVLAGVSTASVSRALNDPEAVSDALRVRVESAAQCLGYVANGAGRTLATRRSGLIGVLVADLGAPDHAALLAALERRFEAAGYFLVVCSATAANAATLGRALVAKGVEGLVLAGVAPPKELLPLTAARGLPCVLAGTPTDHGIPGVGLDLPRAAETVARYLFDLGHRRFALLVPGAAATAAEPARATALKRALRALSQCETVDWDLAEGDPYLAARAMAQSRMGDGLPSAIVCPDDRMAVGCLHACQAAGISVPGAVSLVGFGDTAVARLSQPGLTSVREALAEIGRLAAESLVRRLAGLEDTGAAVAVKLIVRGTTGPVAQSARTTNR